MLPMDVFICRWSPMVHCAPRDRCHWRTQGASVAFLSIQFLSFSCSFRQKLSQTSMHDSRMWWLPLDISTGRGVFVYWSLCRGGAPSRGRPPPACEQNDRCININLPQTSFSGGNNRFSSTSQGLAPTSGKSWIRHWLWFYPPNCYIISGGSRGDARDACFPQPLSGKSLIRHFLLIFPVFFVRLSNYHIPTLKTGRGTNLE